jgi:hypothetical protein
MQPTGTIHFAKFAESERLQRVLYFMLDGQPHTALEIIHGANITAVSAAACELRENGFRVECIKKLNPPTYQLFEPENALELDAELLEKRKAA